MKYCVELYESVFHVSNSCVISSLLVKTISHSMRLCVNVLWSPIFRVVIFMILEILSQCVFSKKQTMTFVLIIILRLYPRFKTLGRITHDFVMPRLLRCIHPRKSKPDTILPVELFCYRNQMIGLDNLINKSKV